MANILITGSNRGIGLELVRTFLTRGDRVFATCRQASEALRGSGATVIEGIDIGDDGVVERLRRAMEGVALDVVVCNAGVLTAESVGSLDWDAVRRQFEVNTLGPLRTVEALLPNLGSGAKVAIITSRMGSIEDNTSGGMYGYRISKSAVNSAGRSLAHDLRARGVAVQLLHPGFVRTEMTGGNGMIEPAESAQGLVRCIDELALEASGTFRHMNGEMLPW